MVLGSGGYGGVQLVGSDLVLRGVRVDGAGSYGIAATRGRLRLARALLTGLTTREGDAGDGLHLRDVEVDVEGLVVRDVARRGRAGRAGLAGGAARGVAGGLPGGRACGWRRWRR